MARIRLEGRERGFFDFESEMMKTEHAGFLKEVGKNLFQLIINPYVKKPRNNNLYVIDDNLIPSDFCKPYQLDAFLEKIEDDGLLGSTTILNEKRRFYFVEGLTEFAKIPKPHIKPEDFVSIVSSGWKRPQDDHLDYSMSLLLLSSPMCFEMVGGLGGESYFISDGHTDETLRRHLKRTLFKCLPQELKTKNSMCSYNLIETSFNMGNILEELEKKKSREVTYNIVRPVNYFKLAVENRIPTVPSTIREASPRRKPSPDLSWDAMEWVLKAQLIRPRSLDELKKKAKKMAKDYNKKYEQSLGQLGFLFNEYNIAQTALSICRLHLSPNFDGNMMLEYDELIKFTSDVAKEIIEDREGRDRLKINEFLRYREDVRTVFSSICKICLTKQEGANLEDVHEDIGYLVEYNRIKKSIDVLREDGYIYSLEPYEGLKPVRL